MSSTPGHQALQILRSRPLKSYIERIYQHRYRVRIIIDDETTEQAAIEAGTLLLINVLTGKWKAKLRTKYVIELLDVAPIAAKAREWRDADGRNILHLMCLKFDYQTIIKTAIEKLGDELIYEKDNNGKYPTTYFLQSCNLFRDYNIKPLIGLLSTKNMAPLNQLKDEVIARISMHPRLSRFTTKDMIINALDSLAKHEIYTDEDRKKVFALLKPRIVLSRPRFLGEPGINGFILHAVKAMKFSADDLEEIYNIIFNDKSTLAMILSWKPDFLDFILRHKVPGFGTLSSSEFELFLQKSFDRVLSSTSYVQLFLTALRLYDPLKFTPLLDKLDARDSKSLLTMAIMVKHIKQLPNQYLPALEPLRDSWIQSPVRSSGETPQSVFPIETLPLEMIYCIISFLSYQSATALSLVNKQFNKHIINSSVWTQMYAKYFPLIAATENKPLIESRSMFYRQYRAKFYLTVLPHYHLPRIEVFQGFNAMELKEDTLVHCNTSKIGVYNLTTRKSITKPLEKPCSARMFDDIVFVYSASSVSLLSKTDLSPLREFDMTVPSTIQDTFAVNDKWLVTPRCVYDWHTSQLMSTWDERLEHVTLRDTVFYGLTTTGLVIKDTRQNEKAAHVEVDTLALGQVSLNTYGTQLYLAGNRIETYDLRYLRRMAVSPFMTKDNSPKVIDLVSMNVWTSSLVWDLIDNKWFAPNLVESSILTSPLVMCNGKELIGLANRGYYLGAQRAPGETYFPYGDFKCHHV